MMCMFDGGDCIDLRSTWQTARKEHRCGECGRTIARGETYHRLVVICDGDLATNKECVHCSWGVNWLRINCHGYQFGGVHEDLREHVLCGAVPPFGQVARVTVGIARRWQRFDGSGLMAVPS